MAKRDGVIYKPLIKDCAKLEEVYALKSICSVGVLVLMRLKPAAREKLIRQAKMYGDKAKAK